MSGPKRDEESPGNVTSGITTSRTLIPDLTPNFISRKHLFPLLENSPSNTTVVLAPSGYGKTSLVAEWAHTKHDRVIWLTLTKNDTIQQFTSMLIYATRNIIPGFAPWFDTEPNISSVEIVRRWSNELLEATGNFILVVDSMREDTLLDTDISKRLVQDFPKNLKFVMLRQDGLETVYSTLSTRGHLEVIGIKELSFSHAEIHALATTQKISLSEEEILELSNLTNGWPHAVSMLLLTNSKNRKNIDFTKTTISQDEPIRLLASDLIRTLNPEVRSMLTSLSVLQEFDQETAKIILKDSYSSEMITQIALEGHYLSQTGGERKTFHFSNLMRDVFLSELHKDKIQEISIHSRLAQFYEDKNLEILAMEHAFLAGDLEKVLDLYPHASLTLQFMGQGHEILHWSKLLGDKNVLGTLQRSAAEIIGHLISLNYQQVFSMIEQMNIDSKGSTLEGYFLQISFRAKAFADFAMCRFEDVDQSFEIAKQGKSESVAIDIEELLSLYRIAAMRHFLFDETEKVELIFEQVKALALDKGISQSHPFISSINAMVNLLYGDYRRAFELASNSYANLSRLNYKGIFSPMESIYIMARCQLQFSRPKEAFALFDELRNLAEKWHQWPWYFIADGYFARDLAFKGSTAESLSRIKLAREKAMNIDFSEGLQKMIDINEIYVRYTLEDFVRVGALLERTPKLNIVRQIQNAYDKRMGKRIKQVDIARLPIRTPREIIWKHISVARANIDNEKLAMVEMKKALDVGAVVAAKESFIRQSDPIRHLILKIAEESPTVYLEDLAMSIFERIKEEDARLSESTANLTRREIEVLRHLSTDKTISYIASILKISQNTLKTHLKSLYKKLEVDSRGSAVDKAKNLYII